MKKQSAKLLLLLNPFLALVLWFLLLTDVEWNGWPMNILFPPLVFAVALRSHPLLRNGAGKRRRLGAFLACFPSLLGGTLYIAFGVFCCTIGLMAMLFSLSEERNKTLWQSELSPGGTVRAEAYFYPVGAYSNGLGRERIFLVNKYFPIVRREVFYDYAVYSSPKDTDRIFRWKDDDTLLLLGGVDDGELDVGHIAVYPAWILSANGEEKRK